MRVQVAASGERSPGQANAASICATARLANRNLRRGVSPIAQQFLVAGHFAACDFVFRLSEVGVFFVAQLDRRSIRADEPQQQLRVFVL